MSIAQTIAKNSLFNFIAMVTDAVSTFIIGIMLARHLGTEQYGLYVLMMWFLSLAAFALTLGMTEMTKRFLAEAMGQRNINTVKGLVRINLVIRGSAVLITSGLIIALSSLLTRLFNVPSDNIFKPA